MDYISKFDNDYDIKDGTCIRDYNTYNRLSICTLQCFRMLRKGNNSDTFNLVNGNGYFVKKVIDVVIKVTGFDIPSKEEEAIQ